MLNKKFIVILLFAISNIVYAQADSSSKEEEEIVSCVESMPQFKGGEGNLMKFIACQIKHDFISKVDEEIIVFVSCWVDTSGVTINHEIIKGVREDLDREALRVAKLVRFDEPAKQRGKPIKIKYFIPVKFDSKKSRH